MIPTYIKDIEKIKLQALSYYQIVGGIIGIGLVILSFAQANRITGLVVVIFAFAIGLFSFSIFCGQQLLKGNIKKGLKLSTINQILQIIHFTILGFRFNYIAGIMLSIGIDLTNKFNFTFNFTFSSIELTINGDKDLLKAGINLFAIYLVFFIDKLEDKIEQDKELFNESYNETANKDIT